MVSRHRNWYGQALMGIVLLMGLYFLGSFAREVVQGQRLSNQLAITRAQNDQLAAQNRQLQRDRDYYQSDAYVHLRARTDLNLRDPNEILVYPMITPQPGAEAGTSGPGAAVTSQRPPVPAVTPTPGRSWDRWLALIAGPSR